jgi:hypothetical protein
MTTHMAARSACLLLALAGLLPPATHAQPADDGDMDIKVEIVGELVRVDVSFHVQASVQEAWGVLTDYDHAADFISDLESSRVLARAGDTVHVAQKGKLRYGPFSFPVESVREIQLLPFERILSRTISGNMRKLETTTRLAAEGTGTRVVSHVDSIPDFWLPPIVGRFFVEHEAQERFGELRKEMLRRTQPAAGK